MDNLGHPSSREILDEFQRLEVGQWVPMSAFGEPTKYTAFKVAGFERHRWLLWSKPESSWVWTLTPMADGTTRLVSRVHAARDWREPGTALLGVVLMEFGDFAMFRRMLLGIKERAEARSSRACSGLPLLVPSFWGPRVGLRRGSGQP